MRDLLALSLLVSCAGTSSKAPDAAQTHPVQAEPASEHHAWLMQLLGEWELSSEASMAPGEEPVLWESTESVRAIGGLWVVSEGSARNGAEPFTSIMTLGYDPKAGHYVGSWVDSMQTKMWTYVGRLDDDRRVLTLEAEGPSMEDPERMTRYRDQIEILAPGQRRMVSSVLGADGSWTTFMSGEARRIE